MMVSPALFVLKRWPKWALMGINAHAFGKMAFLRRVYWTSCEVFFYQSELMKK